MGELQLWVIGDTCSKRNIVHKLQDWRLELLHDIRKYNVAEKLGKSSNERFALAYFFEVLLFDSLKDAILEHGPEYAAVSLRVSTVSLLFLLSSTDAQQRRTQNTNLECFCEQIVSDSCHCPRMEFKR